MNQEVKAVSYEDKIYRVYKLVTMDDATYIYRGGIQGPIIEGVLVVAQVPLCEVLADPAELRPQREGTIMSRALNVIAVKTILEKPIIEKSVADRYNEVLKVIEKKREKYLQEDERREEIYDMLSYFVNEESVITPEVVGDLFRDILALVEKEENY